MNKLTKLLILTGVASAMFTGQVSAVVNTTIPEFTETFVNDSDIGDLDRYYYFDVNNDGTDDVILTPFGGSMTSQIRVFISQNDGTFSAPTYYDTSATGVTRFQGAYHADINGDGFNDFMAPGVAASNSLVFINDGSGGFTFQTLPNSLSNPTAARIPPPEQTIGQFWAGFVDLDSDGDLDYVGTDFSGDDWATYIYDGSTFTETVYNNTYTLGSASANYGWATDMDNDGDIDVLQYINGSAGVDVQFNLWENDGSAVFTESTIFTGDPTRAVNYRNGHAVFDIDNDGDKDVISEGNETGNFIVHQNDGLNSFAPIQTINYEPGKWIQTHVSDLDNDGDFDIGLYDVLDDNSTAVYMNDGSGAFVFSSIEPISYGIPTQDFNSDGEQDIISAPGRSIGVGTEGFVQFGDAPFSYDSNVFQLYDYGNEFSQFEVRDFTGDGFEDILISESDYYATEVTGDENKFVILENTDNDQDGLPNEEEIALGSDSTTSDSDNDGISDVTESTADTDINNPDTDGDGIKDGIEDANQNGIVDEGETDPTDADSDDDGLEDGEEDLNKNGIVDEGEIDPLEGDTDTDGIDELIESNAPNSGDNNNDGVLDAAQDSVASDVNPVIGNKYNSLVVDEANQCATISKLDFLSEDQLPKDDSGYDYPVGLFDFEIQCSVNGGVAEITFILDKVYDTSEWEWRKYDPNSEEYVEVDGVVFGSITIGGEVKTTAQFSITDGANLDDDQVSNSTILDPSGPAVMSATLANTGKEVTLSFIVGISCMAGALYVSTKTQKEGY